jgi:hypothetical protein
LKKGEQPIQTIDTIKQNSRVVAEFAGRTLANIPSQFGRLYLLASLKDTQSGTYRHRELSTEFPAEAVHQTLEFCHSELFYRTLELDLETQTADLAEFLKGAQNTLNGAADLCRDLFVPEGMPAYLHDQFSVNLRCCFAALRKVTS